MLNINLHSMASICGNQAQPAETVWNLSNARLNTTFEFILVEWAFETKKPTN